jgi:hypothetical protein
MLEMMVISSMVMDEIVLEILNQDGHDNMVQMTGLINAGIGTTILLLLAHQ